MDKKKALIWAIYAISYEMEKGLISKDEFIQRSLKYVDEVFSLTDVVKS